TPPDLRVAERPQPLEPLMRTSLVDARVQAPHPWVGWFVLIALLASAALWSIWQVVANATRPDTAVTLPPPAAPLGQVWVGTDKTAETLAGLDVSTTSTFLGGSTSFSLGAWGGASVPSQAWASEAQFAAD